MKKYALTVRVDSEMDELLKKILSRLALTHRNASKQLAVFEALKSYAAQDDDPEEMKWLKYKVLSELPVYDVYAWLSQMFNRRYSRMPKAPEYDEMVEYIKRSTLWTMVQRHNRSNTFVPLASGQERHDLPVCDLVED